MSELSKLMESVLPFIVNTKKSSIEISLSKRFLLFKLLDEVNKTIEDDPYLNFISVLKNYKLLGKILTGTVKEHYKNRNKFYFKKFFYDKKLYENIKKDIEWAYSINKDVKLTISKRGLLVYDNYNRDSFNTLLLTVHSGNWIPERIEKKQSIGPNKRKKEEDIFIDRIYGPLVLVKGGIWVDIKSSRFACDYNRPVERAIYSEHSETWIQSIWDMPLTKAERKWLIDGYHEFYFTLTNLMNSYSFNIIFDAHSMKDGPDRSEISFGTEYIPIFYIPIVRSLQRKMINLGYITKLNQPYKGGNILRWMHDQFPDRFIFSMEINKKLYLNKDLIKPKNRKLNRITKDILKIFDIEDEMPENQRSIMDYH